MINRAAKGKKYEQEVARDLRVEGSISVERTPRSGATSFAKGDLRIRTDFAEYRAECKRRKSVPGWLTSALEGEDILFMREDGGETLCVVRLPLLKDLLQ